MGACEILSCLYVCIRPRYLFVFVGLCMGMALCLAMFFLHVRFSLRAGVHMWMRVICIFILLALKRACV